MITCRTCGTAKPETDYYRLKTGKPFLDCKPCNIVKVMKTREGRKEEVQVYMKAYTTKNKAALQKQRKVYCEGNKDLIRAARVEYLKTHGTKVKITAKRGRDKNKEIVYRAYGEVCKCCGEADKTCLSIDHVNNDGAQHRKEVGSGSGFYQWLINNSFPKDFQTLCRNCNWAKHINKGKLPSWRMVKQEDFSGLP